MLEIYKYIIDVNERECSIFIIHYIVLYLNKTLSKCVTDINK